MFRIAKWSILNRPSLNVSECAIVSISKKQSILTYSYQNEIVMLLRCNNIRDLVVTFDCRLAVNEHNITSTVAKAYQLIGFLYRNCRDFRSSDSLKGLYI